MDSAFCYDRLALFIVELHHYRIIQCILLYLASFAFGCGEVFNSRFIIFLDRGCYFLSFAKLYFSEGFLLQ